MDSISNEVNSENNQLEEKPKILLAMLPFWAPLIPPLGIANLKSFLQERGYEVHTLDGNVAEEFRDFSSNYFDALKEGVPEENWANFYVVGKDVLQNHMMAHLHYESEAAYYELVEILVKQTFFCSIDTPLIERLNRIVEDFFDTFEAWFGAILEEEDPGVVGFSVFESTLPASVFAARVIKDFNPETRVVFGGGVFSEQLAKDSPNLDFFIQFVPHVDAFIMGEGENLFLQYLQNRFPPDQRVFDLNDVDGETTDLATLKIPDFTDFDLKQYPFIATYTSRSCPFQCSFCSETVFYGKYRKKDSRQIVWEMTKLYRNFGRQLFLMCDSLLNPVVDSLAQEFIDSDMLLYWDGYLRADKHVCNPDNTILWRRGGFYKAKLGIESASPKILEKMNKKITPQQIKDAVGSLAQAGIKTSTCWVVGHPGETEEDFQLTLNMLEELKDDIYEVWVSPFYYYPSAQVDMEVWEKETYTVYPETMADMLVIQTWYPSLEPSRRESYDRMYRFVAHCEKLGIPNPHSLYDLHQADRRWKELHDNAVPSLLDFDKGYIDDTANVKKRVLARSKSQEEGDFGF